MHAFSCGWLALFEPLCFLELAITSTYPHTPPVLLRIYWLCARFETVIHRCRCNKQTIQSTAPWVVVGLTSGLPSVVLLCSYPNADGIRPAAAIKSRMTRWLSSDHLKPRVPNKWNAGKAISIEQNLIDLSNIGHCLVFDTPIEKKRQKKLRYPPLFWSFLGYAARYFGFGCPNRYPNRVTAPRYTPWAWFIWLPVPF
jgi:hypothetical protein